MIMKHDDVLRLRVHPESYSFQSALELMKNEGALMVLEPAVFRDKQDPRLFFYAATPMLPQEKYDGNLNFRKHAPKNNDSWSFCDQVAKYIFLTNV